MAENDKSLAAVVSIAQTLLKAEEGRISITPDVIAEKVKLAALALASVYPEGVDQQAACVELVRRFSHWIGKDSSLEDNSGHEKWLDASRKKDWRYWQRYQGYLEKKLSVEVVEALDRSTDRILGLLEDPKRQGSWDRRGLVVGHVQSGKTGNYSGLVCKAADAGYKVIIVLAGLHNNLRSQTQIRLEESFLGYETSATRDPGKPIGVAEIDSDPSIHPHCATTRADNGDFNVAVARHFAISPEERPWLFVVKKNKSVLTQLLKWIRSHVADSTDNGTGRRIVTRLPLLVIDDEADNASVDTGEQLFNDDGTPDDEHEPKAINGLIRKILHAFDKSAYVGYTATPFANIFIHRRNETTDEGPDLFPRSFIVNLAAPSNYMGPARMFGLRSTEGRTGGLPLMHYVTDHVNQDAPGGWMPPKHNKDHVPTYAGQEILPPSLKSAVRAFVLACCAREIRGHTFARGLTIDALLERTGDTNIQDRYSIGRLLSPKDESIDLDDQAWQAALASTIKAWKSDPARQSDGDKRKEPELPNGPAVRRIRGRGADGIAPAPERGLLLLYPLDPKLSKVASLLDQSDPVMAFGVSFPSSDSGLKVEYRVDHLLWEQEYGPAE